METKELVEAMEEGFPPKAAIPEKDLLSTGSTLLNLALTGKTVGGYCKGRYFFFVGDSDSGKTFFCLTCLAEAAHNPEFKQYRLIHDDVEGGALMDITKFFGSSMAKRLEPPAGTRQKPQYSKTVEEFYFHLDDALENSKPFIYVLDSQDALDSDYSEKKFKEKKVAYRNRKKAKGDYGDGKAKFHSGRLRRICSRLTETGSILIIINQTRDNVDGGLFEPTSIYSGGRALRFYASCQIWSSCGAKLKKSVNGKERQIGVTARVQAKKNRLTGKEWTIEVPIYFSYGMDDIGSCVDFLVSEKHWKLDDGKMETDFDGVFGTREQVVKKLEAMGLEDELRAIVQEVWDEVEQGCAVKRKRRYD